MSDEIVGQGPGPAEPGNRGVNIRFATSGELFYMILSRQVTYVAFNKQDATRFIETFKEWTDKLPDLQEPKR
jgi:hypothetical protein